MLNAKTIANKYPMTLSEEIFDRLQGTSVFSTLDLRQGFNQIPIAAADRRKTAFHGLGGSFFEWMYMPFGLVNATAVFQETMDRNLRPCSFASCFVDDVVIYSKSVQEHLEHVREVLERIEAAGLRYHPGKCHFFQTSVQYLGHEVGGSGIRPSKPKSRPSRSSRRRRTSLDCAKLWG